MAVDFDKLMKEINFEQMKSDWLSQYDDEKEGLDDFEYMLERVKKLTDEEIKEIDDSISNGLLDRIEEEASSEFDEKKLELYLKEHPDENSDEYDEDAYNEFVENIPRDTLITFLWECYEEMDDNVTDEMSRSETDSTCEHYSLPRAIVKALCGSAL